MTLPPKRLRFTFLFKFTTITLTVAIGVALVMSNFLIGRHERAVEANEGVNAAGQISAELTAPLGVVGTYDREHDLQRIDAALRPVAEDAQRLQYVTAIRIYRPNGTALYPAAAAPAPQAAQKTLALGDLWSTADTDAKSDTVTQYLPFVAGGGEYVIAIDLSRAQMAAQSDGERPAVIEATASAVLVIFISLVTLAAGASRELERRRREAESTFSRTLATIAQVIDRRDPYTAGHSRRVADYSLAIATAMGFGERERNITERAALLHDLGKIGIPDAILLKASRLDDGERTIMRNHPAIGAEILASIASMEDVVPCVMHHHERVDGQGYPHGLAGSAIPLSARILAVADSYDAMTTDRPYRRALSIPVAIAELRRVTGTQLDADVVDVFERLVASGIVDAPPPAAGDEDLASRFGPRSAVGFSPA